MYKNIEAIEVGISQKVNLGNYETRDYHISLTISGFDNENKEKVKEATEFAKNLCLEEAMQFYVSTKDAMKQTAKLAEDTKAEYKALDASIAQATSADQLKALTEKIASVEDVEIRKILQRNYNLRMISISS